MSLSLVMFLVCLLCIALGAWQLGGFSVGYIRQHRRDRARRKEVDDATETAVLYGKAAYLHLKDPVTQEATMRGIAEKIYTVSAKADLPIAEQFKSRTKVEQPEQSESK